MTEPLGSYLSVDLEDSKHAMMRELGLPPLCATDQTRRGVDLLLDALEGVDGSSKLTFFSTGQIGRTQRALVSELARYGHEIGCHTDEHDNVCAMTRERLVEDLRRSRGTLQDASGQDVTGFRAPNFSMDVADQWAFEALAECGFRYDSSLRMSRRAVQRRQAWDHHMLPSGASLYEFPLYIRRLCGVRMSVIGGTYFRLLPIRMIFGLLTEATANGFTPLIYLHAADLFTGGPIVTWRELAGLSLLERAGWRVRQYQWTTRAHSVPDKLRAVLRRYPNLGPMRSALPS
ncbi:MAG: polysaccharide deacetylase family protein [Vicinamibacterales bacterium]